MLRRCFVVLVLAAASITALCLLAPRTTIAGAPHVMHNAVTPIEVPGSPGAFQYPTANGMRTSYWAPNKAAGVPDVVINALISSWQYPNGEDTTVVPVGTHVRWHRTAGSHTITDGLGIDDTGTPGQHFDYVLDASRPDFDTTFSAPDTVNYFCWFHEPFMRGTVIVKANADVPPVATAAALSFARPPSPNPSRGSMTFAVVLPTEALVQVDVWDLSGRLVANVAKETLPAGEHPFQWDGRTTRGARAATGTYLVRVTADGAKIAKRFTLIR